MDATWNEKLKATQREARRQSQGHLTKGQVVSGRPVSFFSYMPALCVAILKDLLDLVFIGSLPGLGTIITLCFSILIFFLLMLSGSGQRYSLAKKSLILLIGTLTEGVLIGINMLPIETMTVLFIYFIDKKASKSRVELEA
ncbi:MAG: hypothetical protein PHT88_02920 [Candidatus Moranbacteria bacterium]|nr:hypothetical protein [Candidatus Moranbacteria bacterium]